MATFNSSFLYALDQNGNSTNGKVVSQIPNSASQAVESIPDGTVDVGETFTVTFSDPLTGATYDGIYTYVGDETDGSGAVGQDSHGNYFLFSENGGIPDGQNLNNFKAEALPLCFAAGTLIRTPRGDVPVEQLNAGDLVETSTGASRPVKWIGHRVIDCRKYGPKAALPIRIAADAFGPDRPSQDLVVTPGHSICVDLIGETFVSAGNLVNGASIAQVEVDEIDCWHVELDSHDVLLANNLPAESYLDVGNRGFFADDGATLDPDEVFKNAARTYDDFCRPRMESAALSFVRSRLVARARAIGWTPSYEMDLHLVVDGDVRRPLSEGNGAVFLFPASARDVRLMSNTFVPALVGNGDGGDTRPLGVRLKALVFSGGRGAQAPIPLDDERLKNGLHPEEGRDGVDWRWTKGELALSPDFWEGLSGHVALLVTHDTSSIRGWTAPAAARRQTSAYRPKLRTVG